MSMPAGFGVVREGFVPEWNEGATIESSRKASSMLTPFFKKGFCSETTFEINNDAGYIFEVNLLIRI